MYGGAGRYLGSGALSSYHRGYDLPHHRREALDMALATDHTFSGVSVLFETLSFRLVPQPMVRAGCLADGCCLFLFCLLSSVESPLAPCERSSRESQRGADGG